MNVSNNNFSPHWKEVSAVLQSIEPVVTNGKTRSYLMMQCEERDGVKWYSVDVFRISIMKWIKAQPSELWEFSPGVSWGVGFVMHEKLYTIFALTWS